MIEIESAHRAFKSGMRLIAAAVLVSSLAVLGCQHDEPAALVSVRALADRACACPDVACIEAVTTDAAVLSYELDGELSKLESSELKRLQKQEDRLMSCVTRVLQSGE